eukprot:9327672-Prorocentrum_lima.AAC.1
MERYCKMCLMCTLALCSTSSASSLALTDLDTLVTAQQTSGLVRKAIHIKAPSMELRQAKS